MLRFRDSVRYAWNETADWALNQQHEILRRRGNEERRRWRVFLARSVGSAPDVLQLRVQEERILHNEKGESAGNCDLPKLIIFFLIKLEDVWGESWVVSAENTHDWKLNRFRELAVREVQQN